MKAYDTKKGNVVEHNGNVYQIRDIERSSPQGRGGNVKFRFTMYSVPGGNNSIRPHAAPEISRWFQGSSGRTKVIALPESV